MATIKFDSSPDPDRPAPSSELEARVIEALRTVYDPEIPVNIYDLGLIYAIDTDPGHNVSVRMTLTSPACPVAGTLPGEVESTVQRIADVNRVRVEVVWDPPWTPDRLDEATKLQLGLL